MENINFESPPRLRTLSATHRLLNELDPDTAYSMTALRRDAKTGKFKTVEVESKILVNIDSLFEYLAGVLYNEAK